VEPTLVTFAAPDGTDLSADLYAARDGTRAPIILLFHQAASNAGEYAAIARTWSSSAGTRSPSIRARAAGCGTATIAP
jgi:hypothetical protein